MIRPHSEVAREGSVRTPVRTLVGGRVGRGLVLAGVVLAALLVVEPLVAEAAAQERRTAQPRSGSSASSGDRGSSGGSATARGSSRSSARSGSSERTARPRSGSEPADVRRPGTRHDRRGDGHYDSRHRTRYYYLPPSWNTWDWYWSWNVWSGWYDPWGYWYRPRVVVGVGGWDGWGNPWWGRRPLSDSMGAMDLDVSPEEAEVWVDGERLGEADDFDGWPGYLWLEEGVYQVAYHREGYETIARQVTIRPGVVIRVDDDMVRGETIHPRDLYEPPSTERRDARLERREEIRRELDEREELEGRDDAPADWKIRVERDRRDLAGERQRLDARDEPAVLDLGVVPDDAAVYLDGEFLGVGRDVAGSEGGVLVDPGAHELQVTRPGYAPQTLTFEVEAGESVSLEVTLEPADGP